jgi:pSer/pThr/pTyr-binding forkhead associated (FHA) protein
MVIEPGKTLSVGRTERADLVVHGDDQMSGVHLELAWDGATCHLRDLKSATGTLLDGMPVTVATVPHGSWIRAGGTNFSLYIEEATPPPLGSVDMSSEGQARAHQVLEVFLIEGEQREVLRFTR